MENPIVPLNLQVFWEQLLSRDLEQIRSAYSFIAQNELPAVIAHLKRMIEEPGWQTEQRSSARAALETIQKLQDEIKPGAGSTNR